MEYKALCYVSWISRIKRGQALNKGQNGSMYFILLPNCSLFERFHCTISIDVHNDYLRGGGN